MVNKSEDLALEIARLYWRIESGEFGGTERKAKLFSLLRGLSYNNDPITMLPNNFSLEESLKLEIEKAKSSRRPLSAIMISIDNFAQYSDTYGSEQGIEAVVHVAKILMSILKTRDIVGRYEGENYLLILPQTNEGGAKAVAEKITTEVKESKIDKYVGPENARDVKYSGEMDFRKLTVSLGIAVYNLEKDYLDSLVSNARSAMYQARNESGDRFGVYKPS